MHIKRDFCKFTYIMWVSESPMTMVDKIHAAVLRVFLNYALNTQELPGYQTIEDRIRAAQRASLHKAGSS